MSDGRPVSDPTRSRDELASAHIDGLTTPDQAAAIEADPDLAARVEELRRAAQRVSEPVEPPAPSAVDALIIAALAALEDDDRDEANDGRTPTVRLGARRVGRSRRARRLPSPAVAAALIAIIALVGIGLIIRGSSGSDSPSASNRVAATTTPSAASGTDQPARAGDNNGGSDAAPATLIPDLGSFPDQRSLTAVLARIQLTTLADAQRGTTTGPSDTTTGAPGGAPGNTAERRVTTAEIDRCDNVIRSVPGQDLGERLAVAGAVLDGRKILVYSHPVTGGSASKPVTILTVADAESCSIAFAVQR